MLTRILATAALAALPSLAMADPTFSAADVESHFSKGMACGADGVCLPKPLLSRKVCIGTDSDCAAEEAANAAKIDPGAFDMLITFELGSDRLSRQARENLAEVAKALKGDALENATFSIDGHTDARGTDEFNLILSNRRAAAVVEYLEGLGIPRSRLKATGFGEDNPRVDDPFAAINRRVEASLKLR